MSLVRRAVTLTLALGLTSSIALSHGEDHFTVLAGAGQDTTVVSAFMPEVIRVTVGTTVTWRINSDEVHTVTFFEDRGPTSVHELPPLVVPAPGGQEGMVVNPAAFFPTRMPGSDVEAYAGDRYVNSGILSHQPMGPDAPPNDTFQVTFTEPGTYRYHCILHPWMTGTVIVEEAMEEADSHEDVDARAEAEMQPLLDLVDRVREQAQPVYSEPGPFGTTVWYVKAGAVDAVSGDARATAFDFFPQHLTVEAGDTVVWTSPEFHTVTFDPVPPLPMEFIPVEQDQGPPMLFINPEVFFPVKPSGTFDYAQYFNSGVIGRVAPTGMSSWSLTFDRPGTYEYSCIFHDAMGMRGSITVVARQ